MAESAASSTFAVVFGTAGEAMIGRSVPGASAPATNALAVDTSRTGSTSAPVVAIAALNARMSDANAAAPPPAVPAIGVRP